MLFTPTTRIGRIGRSDRKGRSARIVPTGPNAPTEPTGRIIRTGPIARTTQIVPNAKKTGMSVKAYIQESIVKPNAYITPGYQANIMPQSFAQSLTATQIQALVNFIASVTH